MNKSVVESTQIPLNTCSLCKKSTAAKGTSVICFGEWMVKNDIVAHYYCLLLSTHLPQHGADHNGILGFLLRDIRIEISKAEHRKCIYCLEMSATIQCAKCMKYFHLTCGHTSKCLSQFVGEFKSYCHSCVPVDEYRRKLFARKQPKSTELCYICSEIMGSNTNSWIYAKCCGSGYTHSKCMKMYALSAGYYLSCIWCKDKRFREDIKYLGVFVPDRDANWEREKGAYSDLYRRHKRCDVEVCNCPKGRDYSKAPKWLLVLCKLCGASGAHSPGCMPGHTSFGSSKEKPVEYKCDVCSVIEQTLLKKRVMEPVQSLIDTSLYVNKNEISKTVGTISSSQTSQNNSVADPALSQNAIGTTNLGASSPVLNTSNPNDALENMKLSPMVYTLTQSPQKSEQNLEAYLKILKGEKSYNIDDVVADLLAQKMLNLFG